MRQVLIINGPCGVGKTTAACAISDLLCERAIAHQHLDFDSLTQTFPRPSGDPFAVTLGVRALAAAMVVYDSYGPRPLILPMVVEEREELSFIAQVLQADITHTRLTAPQSVRHQRLAGRETGDWLKNLSARSDELSGILDAANLPGLTLDTTNQTPQEVALAILAQTGWLNAAPNTLATA